MAQRVNVEFRGWFTWVAAITTNESQCQLYFRYPKIPTNGREKKKAVKKGRIVDDAIEATPGVALFNCAILRRKWVTLARLMSFAEFPQLRHRGRHSARWSFLVIEKFFAPREKYEFFKYFSYFLLHSWALQKFRESHPHNYQHIFTLQSIYPYILMNHYYHYYKFNHRL